VQPFVTETMMRGVDDFFRARAYADFEMMPKERQQKVLPFIAHWCGKAVNLSGADAMRGLNQVMILRDACIRASSQYDFMLSPTSPITAYAAELPCPTDDPERPFEHISFTAPFNMSEQPAASICCGHDEGGLPIGLQIIGQRFDDIGVLRMAKIYEDMRPALKPWPEPPKSRP